MPPKSKVLTSPHVNQILDWIDEGKSSRWISRELENQFNESIGHVAINNFKKKNITSEALEIVDAQLKEESKQKQKEKEVKSKVSTIAQNKAEQKITSEHKVNGLKEATAKQLKGVLNVADHFEADYYKLRDEAADEQSKTSWKDVAYFSFQATKLAHEIIDGSSMETSITEGFGELADAIKKSREIHKES